jgi:DNA repair exonuclease SbcCD nuclease subunit
MRVMYLGDLHGNFNLIGQYIDRFGIKDTHIIQVGDFGLGFKSFIKESRELELYHKKLVKNNVIVYAIRGNHDFPKYFENDPFLLTNIKLIKDYTVLNLEGNNILFIGGAISVDRKSRMTKHQKEKDFDPSREQLLIGGESWWPNEKFNLDLKLLDKLRDINIVVTHTAPDYCYPDNSNGLGPFVNGFIQNGDDTLKMDLMDERRHLTLAFQAIKENNDITHHYYGHFHKSDITNIYGTKHRLLGIGELWEERDKEII